jgi:hypothetical protein
MTAKVEVVRKSVVRLDLRVRIPLEAPNAEKARFNRLAFLVSSDCFV